jgi:hypothetical protein
MQLPVSREERPRPAFIAWLSRLPRIYVILSLAILCWVLVFGLWTAGQVALNALLA